MTPRALLTVCLAALAAIATPPGASGQASGNSASITVRSGPHKGTYAFAPKEACVLAAFGTEPLGVSVVMSSDEASLSIDVPNLDEKHASELRVVLVVADSGGAGGSMSTATYEIDTRPEASLKPLQRAERGNRGTVGKATTTLMTQGNAILLSFTGEAAHGVTLDGEVTCRKVQ